MEHKGCALISGKRLAYLDHIVPLARLLNFPLLTTDQSLYQAASLFYPKMPLLFHEGEEGSLDKVLDRFDHFLYVEPSRMGHGGFWFGEHLYKKDKFALCGLHGNSDKSLETFWFERFNDEKFALVYGEQMCAYFKEKKVTVPYLKTGNYRRSFYEEYRPFFDRLIAPYLFDKKVQKTLLYAPTWTFGDKKSPDYSPFFEVFPFIAEDLPEEFGLIVKLHPYLYSLYPQQVEELKQKYKSKKNIEFLPDIPLIYPLLSKVDLFIGDVSSVGYDFLSFNRPLFLFNPNKRDLPLYRASKEIFPEDYSKIYKIIEEHDSDALKPQREELYSYAFGEKKELTTLQLELKEIYADRFSSFK